MVAFREALGQYYQVLAVNLLNISIFFLLINFALFVVFKIKDKYLEQGENSIPSLKKVYPDLSEEEINDLLNEC